MNIIWFNDYYVAKSKAQKRAETLFQSILIEMEHEGKVPQKGQAEAMKKKLVDTFYQQEKARIGKQMMISEADIYRTAKLIIDQYGEGALIEAALRQDKFLEQGDLNGAQTWSRIGTAIEWMQSPLNLTEETSH